MFSVDYQARVATFSRRLEGLGVPEEFALSVAYGIVTRLRWQCWTDYDDNLGSATRLAKAADWRRNALALATALSKSALVTYDDGHYYLTTALREAPANIRYRWRERSPETYKTAMKRAEENIIPETSEPEQDFEVDLFGEPVAKPAVKKKTKPDKGHSELIEYWVTEWAVRYKRRYPFCPRDAKCIKDIREGCENLSASKAAIDAFLGDRDGYLVKRCHPLHLIHGRLAGYIGKPARQTQDQRSYTESLKLGD